MNPYLSALLGSFTGALAAAILGLQQGRTELVPGVWTSTMGWIITPVLPGLIFGIAFGIVLHQQRLLPFSGAVLYALAAGMSHALAFYAAFFSLGWIESVLGRDSVASFAVTGVLAGALGGGLLAAASALLLPGMRWPPVMAVGAVLGALLPLGNFEAVHGVWVFYILWQAGYAAAFAASLGNAR